MSDSKEQEAIEHKIKSVRKYCEFFTDMAIQSFECQQFTYSIQALSAVIAARRICGIRPIWSYHFEWITGYNFEHIEEWYTKLYLKYEKFFMKSKMCTSKITANPGDKENKVSKKHNFISISSIQWFLNIDELEVNKPKPKVISRQSSLGKKIPLLKERSNGSLVHNTGMNSIKSR